MIQLQHIINNPPTQDIEIDRVIEDLRVKILTRFVWTTHAYGKAYPIEHKLQDKTVVLPMVYVGNVDGKYRMMPVTPDNDKAGTVFFVNDKESQMRFESNSQNYLTYNLGIVVWLNLSLIDKLVSDNEDFTQLQIRDLRNLLTNGLVGAGYRVEILNVTRNTNEVFREYKLHEKQYNEMPFSAFRFNLNVALQEDCVLLQENPNALLQNITKKEIGTILLPTLDFSGTDFDFLTDQQKTDLLIKLT